jgi:hypothetical protein
MCTRKNRESLFATCTLLIGIAFAACAVDGNSGDDGDDVPDPVIGCGNHMCDPGETPQSCPADCSGSMCGNHMCEAGETSQSCPADCSTCGNHVCDSGETAQTCPADCVVCGNNVCDPGETPQSCPGDCSTCGNHVCDPGETHASCPGDCAEMSTCNNHICEAGETSTCPNDCPATLRVANTSSYVIWYLYLAPCFTSSWSVDQLGAHVINPQQTFTLTGVPPACWRFRATNSNASIYWETAQSGFNLQPSSTFTWTLHN